MRKQEIINAAISGLIVLGPSVARKRRAFKSVLVMRHAWKVSDDGRVLDAVHRAARRWGQNLANQMGREVEIYAKDGSLLALLSPAD